MKEKIWIVAAFVLTFAVGVLTGALLVRSFGLAPFAPMPMGERGPRHFPRPGERAPLPSVEMLQRQFDLDEAQQEQVANIIEKYREEFQEHFRQVHPIMQGLLGEMRGEIESVLRPEQLEKFRREFPPRPRRGLGARPMPRDSAPELPE